MGWTAVGQDDVHSFETAILQEYVDAINERMSVIGVALLDALADGQDAADIATIWSAWQTKLTDNAVSFLAATDFDGLTSFTLFTVSTWLDAAGIPDGFRRVPTSKTCRVSGVYNSGPNTTTITATGGTPFLAAHVGRKLSVLSPSWPGDFVITARTSSTVITIAGKCPCTSSRFSVMPADWTDYADPAFIYGIASDGDVIGPWLLSDLQAALNVLWRTKHLAGVYGLTTNNNRQGYSGAGMSSWAAAKTLAQSNYASGLTTIDTLPYTSYWGMRGGGVFSCGIGRQENKVRFTTPSSLKCDVDWYALYRQRGNVANGNGDFAAHNVGEYHLWLTDAGVTANVVVSSGLFGSLVLPVACAEPGEGVTNETGYELLSPDEDMVAVARWNVAGGFEYV